MTRLQESPTQEDWPPGKFSEARMILRPPITQGFQTWECYGCGMKGVGLKLPEGHELSAHHRGRLRKLIEDRIAQDKKMLEAVDKLDTEARKRTK